MNLLQDLRYGARKLVLAPGFAAVSVVTLALGIGLTTTMFSIVYGALMRGLPFKDGDRIVAIQRTNPVRGWERMPVSQHDLVDYRAQARSFEGLAGYYTGTMNVSGTEKPERFSGGFLSANLFDLIGVRPALGRTFRPGEDTPGAAPVAILSYDLWQSRYGGDRGIVGKVIRINSEPYEVVGVMPERFAFPASEKLWVPLRQPLSAKRGDGQDVNVVAKLRPGVSVERANVEMAAIARRLATQYPESNRDLSARVKSFTDAFLGKQPVIMLTTMLIAVFLVLLIACANVANLLLSQAAMRSKEVAVRTAMGATRTRIVMQFLTEPLALAICGALLGTGLAAIGVKLFNDAIAGTNPPFWIVIKIDGPILLFVLVGDSHGAVSVHLRPPNWKPGDELPNAQFVDFGGLPKLGVAITLFATFVSGVLPAIRVSGGNVNEVLKDESRGSSSLRGGRLSKALVMFEIALSVGLLVGAGLTTKSITNLRTVDFGFPTDVFTARVGLPETVYRDSVAQIRFYDELFRRLGDVQGVEAFSLGTALPALGADMQPFAIEGKAYAKDTDYPDTHYIAAYPNYFRTFNVQVRGRDFAASDTRTSEPVALVSQSLVTKFFGGQDPIGRRIRLGGPQATDAWRTIVGVVPDMWNNGVGNGNDNESPQGVYVPFTQAPTRFVSIVARSRGNPAALTAPVRAAVGGIDPDIPVYFVRTLQEGIDAQTWFYRVFGALFGVMGIVALVLAAVGLYGVMSFNVARRTREMGVRMALGAQPADVIRMVLKQGAVQLVVGLLLGSVLAFLLSLGLKMLLFQVSVFDPLVIGGTVLVLSACAFLASLVPARRATRVDPMVALRYE